MAEMSDLDAGEIAKVCARFPIGRVQSVKRYLGGTSGHWRALVQTDQGDFLLRRRARDEGASSVGASHELLLHLASRGIPVPGMIGTEGANRTMLDLDGWRYEMTRFVEGGGFDGSAEASADAGRMLARCHMALQDVRVSFPLSETTYHDLARFEALLAESKRRLGRPFRSTIVELRSLFHEANAQVDALGFESLPRQAIHGDWHSGNLLFEERRVVGVVDFDSIRFGPPVLDLSNGTLQFSMDRSDPNPDRWSTDPDASRTLGFVAGYRTELSSGAASEGRGGGRGAGFGGGERAWLRMLPWLMVESLIAEALAPIAATGGFGRVSPASILGFVTRRAGWVSSNADRLIDSICR